MLLMKVREGRRKLVWRLWMAVRVWWREEPSSWPGIQSFKRRLSEGSRRFYNHGEGPYWNWSLLLVESAY